MTGIVPSGTAEAAPFDLVDLAEIESFPGGRTVVDDQPRYDVVVDAAEQYSVCAADLCGGVPDLVDVQVRRQADVPAVRDALTGEQLSYTELWRSAGLLAMDLAAGGVFQHPPTNSRGVGPVIGNDPRYVIYTSGSTGKPKGVVLPHRAVVRLAVAPNFCTIEPGDRVANGANPAFDASTFEIWNTLVAGATVAYFDCTADSLAGVDRVPVGYPPQNTSLHVLDEQLDPVAPGDTGELCVGGPAVALGYLGRPDLTAERFVTDPATGAVIYRTGDVARQRPDGAFEVESAITATGLVSAAFVAKTGSGPDARPVGFVLPTDPGPGTGATASTVQRARQTTAGIHDSEPVDRPGRRAAEPVGQGRSHRTARPAGGKVRRLTGGPANGPHRCKRGE